VLVFIHASFWWRRLFSVFSLNWITLWICLQNCLPHEEGAAATPSSKKYATHTTHTSSDVTRICVVFIHWQAVILRWFRAQHSAAECESSILFLRPRHLGVISPPLGCVSRPFSQRPVLGRVHVQCMKESRLPPSACLPAEDKRPGWLKTTATTTTTTRHAAARHHTSLCNVVRSGTLHALLSRPSYSRDFLGSNTNCNRDTWKKREVHLFCRPPCTVLALRALQANLA